MLILPETMGSYRLIDTAEKLWSASGEKQVSGEKRWNTVSAYPAARHADTEKRR